MDKGNIVVANLGDKEVEVLFVESARKLKQSIRDSNPVELVELYGT